MTQPASNIPAAPPLPVPDELTSHYWEGAKQHKLVILQCENGHYIHFPRPVCRYCQSTKLTPKEVSGRGTIHTFTTGYQAFHPYWKDKLPYVYAMVELVEQKGLQVTTNIVDCPVDDVKVGMEVEAVYREVSPGYTFPFFTPVKR